MRSFGAKLADIVTPARCLGCLVEQTWLCARCQRQQLRPFAMSCIICRRETARGETCQRCQDETALTGVVSVGSYGSPLLRRGIHWLKFKGVIAVGPVLAKLLVPSLLRIGPIDDLVQQAVLVPLPLHRSRERSRGFNQSALLAEALAAVTGIPSRTLLTRHRNTWAQTKLPPELRSENVAAAFSFRERLPAARPLAIIIDDVATTGATLSAAAGIVRSAGARWVWGATIARG